MKHANRCTDGRNRSRDKTDIQATRLLKLLGQTDGWNRQIYEPKRDRRTKRLKKQAERGR
jgi:hypothetical protein